MAIVARLGTRSSELRQECLSYLVAQYAERLRGIKPGRQDSAETRRTLRFAERKRQIHQPQAAAFLSHRTARKGSVVPGGTLALCLFFPGQIRRGGESVLGYFRFLAGLARTGTGVPCPYDLVGAW